MPAWTYALANGCSPVSAWACEAPISWCGKTRSEPPPWTSKPMPRWSSAIATHSMCQPGRPSPRRPRPSSARPGGRPSRASGPAGSSCRGARGRRRARRRAGASPPRRARRPRRSAGRRRRRSRRRLRGRRRRPPPQPLHEGHDARYGLDRSDVVLRGQHPQGGHVLAEECRLALRELGPVLTVACGPLQERIVHVGHVLDVVNLPLGVEPHALNEVERVVGRRMTHVGRVVRRDAADVDAGDGTGVKGDPSAGRGVVDPKVAALARQGGDLRSGPGMHVMSVTGRCFRIRTGSGFLSEETLLR